MTKDRTSQRRLAQRTSIPASEASPATTSTTDPSVSPAAIRARRNSPEPGTLAAGGDQLEHTQGSTQN